MQMVNQLDNQTPRSPEEFAAQFNDVDQIKTYIESNNSGLIDLRRTESELGSVRKLHSIIYDSQDELMQMQTYQATSAALEFHSATKIQLINIDRQLGNLNDQESNLADLNAALEDRIIELEEISAKPNGTPHE